MTSARGGSLARALFLCPHGLEKAVLLANILRSRMPEDEIVIGTGDDTVLKAGSREYRFASDKGIEEQEWAIP